MFFNHLPSFSLFSNPESFVSEVSCSRYSFWDLPAFWSSVEGSPHQIGLFPLYPGKNIFWKKMVSTFTNKTCRLSGGWALCVNTRGYSCGNNGCCCSGYQVGINWKGFNHEILSSAQWMPERLRLFPFMKRNRSANHCAYDSSL